MQITEYQTQCDTVTNTKTKCDIVYAQKCDKVSSPSAALLCYAEVLPAAKSMGNQHWRAAVSASCNAHIELRLEAIAVVRHGSSTTVFMVRAVSFTGLAPCLMCSIHEASSGVFLCCAGLQAQLQEDHHNHNRLHHSCIHWQGHANDDYGQGSLTLQATVVLTALLALLARSPTAPASLA